MDPVMFRGIERLLIVVGGIFLAYLGYRLFTRGIAEGASKLDVKTAWAKVVFSGTGPGLIFMLAGTGILIAAIWGKLSIEDDPSKPHEQIAALTKANEHLQQRVTLIEGRLDLDYPAKLKKSENEPATTVRDNPVTREPGRKTAYKAKTRKPDRDTAPPEEVK